MERGLGFGEKGRGQGRREFWKKGELSPQGEEGNKVHPFSVGRGGGRKDVRLEPKDSSRSLFSIRLKRKRKKTNGSRRSRGRKSRGNSNETGGGSFARISGTVVFHPSRGRDFNFEGGKLIVSEKKKINLSLWGIMSRESKTSDSHAKMTSVHSCVGKGN